MTMRECPSGKIWDPTTEKCLGRRDGAHKDQVDAYVEFLQSQWNKRKLHDFVDREIAPPKKAKLAAVEPMRFKLRPGDRGFNDEAAFHMKDLLSATEDQLDCTSRAYKPYQKTVQFMTDPRKSPVESLLVAHRTGAGKTLTMLLVLDNYFTDPRPKILVFPNTNVRDNFYSELLEWDNLYRTYLLDKLKSTNRALPGDKADRVALAKELLGNPTTVEAASVRLYAPLRAFTYNEVAGKGAEANAILYKPTRNLLASAWEQCTKLAGGRLNLMCNKIVLMDEAHNLTHPDEDITKNRFTIANLAHLRTSLLHARNSVKVLFTATPVISEVDDARKILDVVKGIDNLAKSDEGFVSAFYASPVSAYPVVTPPDRFLPTLVAVELEGTAGDKTSALGNYVQHAFVGLNTPKPSLNKAFMTAMNRDVFEYVASAFNTQTRSDFLKRLRTNPRLVAPKLYKAAKLVLLALTEEGQEGKAIVLTAKRHGFFSLGYMIENCPEFASIAGGRVRTLLGKTTSTRSDLQTHSCGGRNIPGGSKLTLCVKEEFNDPSNIRGNHIGALLLNQDEFSEGIDFKGIRKVILLDVAGSWGRMLQQVGRAVRNCSHAGLPPELRTVDTYVLVATLPHAVIVKRGQKGQDTVSLDLRTVLTVDEQRLINLVKSREEVEAVMCNLINGAVDRQTLAPFTDGDHCPFVAATDFFQKFTMEEDQKARLTCDATFHKCHQIALRQNYASQDDLQLLYHKCTNEHMTCLTNLSGRTDAVDPKHPNCPGVLYEDECDVFCDKYKLSADDHTKCVERRNIPARVVQADAAASEAAVDDVCPNCAEGEDCAVACKAHKLQGEDLYRCMAGINNQPCRLERVPEEEPEAEPQEDDVVEPTAPPRQPPKRTRATKGTRATKRNKK